MHILWVIEGECVEERAFFFKKGQDSRDTIGRNCYRKERRNTEQSKTAGVYIQSFAAQHIYLYFFPYIPF